MYARVNKTNSEKMFTSYFRNSIFYVFLGFVDTGIRTNIYILTLFSFQFQLRFWRHSMIVINK